MNINELWYSHDPTMWEQAIDRYWSFVRPENIELERSLNELNLQLLKNLNPQSWYEFLRDDYFRWKFTAKNRYASTTIQLKRHIDDGALNELNNIRQRLLDLNPNETLKGLKTAKEIHGLGTAGASGLLSLMYPKDFATVDQFVVRALRQIDGLADAGALNRMKPEGLTLNNGLLLISILTRKAIDNNLEFGTLTWTPRKIDMVLWTFGR